MRLLVVAEDAPTTSPLHGNGSTMIPGNIIPELPADLTVDLAYFDAGHQPSGAVLARVGRLWTLPRRPHLAAVAATLVTGLPRATWRLSAPAASRTVREAAATADAVWVHGLHAFAATLSGLDPLSDLPVIAHEVDPWSTHWQSRAATRGRARRAYDLRQAALACRLEARMSSRAAAYVVVSPQDARSLGAALGREVLAIPNGVAAPAPPASGTCGSAEAPGPPRQSPSVGFLGSLGYPPNVEAVAALARDVMPLVRQRVPGTVLRIAGRGPLAAVREQAGPGVDVIGAVDDPARFFGSCDVVAFAGTTGTGTKNTVLEALACGAAVVATPQSARNLPSGAPIRIVAGPDALAAAIVTLLGDEAGRSRLGAQARVWARGLPTWTSVARTWADLLAEITRPVAARG